MTHLDVALLFHVIVGVDFDAVVHHFEVQMGAGGIARAADRAECAALENALATAHIIGAHMRI